MKKSYTPEEVRKIEDAAYETGKAVGQHMERTRIIEVLRDVSRLNWEDLELIKSKLATKKLSEEERSDLEDDRLISFLYLSGINGALKSIEHSNSAEQ